MTVAEAETQIAKILKQLEIDTDSVIDAIGVADFETTGVTDIRRQLARSVRITLKRNPGSNWGV